MTRRRAQDFAFDFAVECNEVATAYYVVLASGSPPPTTVDVVAGTDGVGSPGVDSGVVAVPVPGNTTIIRVNSTLAATTTYDVYLFVQVRWKAFGTPNATSRRLTLPVGCCAGRVW